ncbi:MAG: twin-arginine translocation pathway signal protein [Campylobacteraceae bacterium]|jgi:hypothetical protein|nr:twin-arginine translocation pathway signal protein [Campylobacteraceae bacterium]
MHRRTFLGYGALGFASLAFGSLNDTHFSQYFTSLEMEAFEKARVRLGKVRGHIGFGNFNIVDFDTVLYYARNVSSIGEFTKDELSLLERLFYEDPNKYGFFGKQTCKDITIQIKTKEVQKIPHSGHYVFKGEPLAAFEKLTDDIGPTLVLTSGIRGVPKQMELFLNKIKSCDGDMKQAVKSIAPPAHSYHSIGDFDVGKKGFGHLNFSEEFAKTKEFEKLQTLPYIKTRYSPNNADGVQYEPWHVEIITMANRV